MIAVCRDADELAQVAAERIAALADAAVCARGRCAIALSGGETPRETYRRLGAHRMPWPQVDLFWSDERCVGAEDPRSNYGMARDALLDAIPVAPAQVHRIDCAGGPEAAARRYEAMLRSHFGVKACRFDVILLGLGEDGHTASLFPGSQAASERERWVVPARVAGQPFARVTLTVPAINAARTVVFLASGEAKARALQRVLEGPRDPLRVPAQFVHPVRGEILWVVDEAAAGLLTAPHGNGRPRGRGVASRPRVGQQQTLPPPQSG